MSQVAVYVPGSKGAPSFVRLYQYPNFGGPTSALANKSFFKSDRVAMLLNKKGWSESELIHEKDLLIYYLHPFIKQTTVALVDGKQLFIYLW